MSIKTFYARHKIIYTIILALLLLIIAYFGFLRKSSQTFNVATVQYADLVQEVSATGNVKPAKNVDLAFSKSGRIAAIYVSVGDKVSQGMPLAALDSSEISAQILQAKASLDNQEAKLEALKSGTRPEQINVSKADLAKSKQDLANYYNGAIPILNDAYAKADDAVRNQTDSLFSNPNSDSPQLIISSSDSQAVIDATTQRITVRNQMSAWRNDLDSITDSTSQDTLDSIIANSKNRLSIVSNFLLRLSDVLNSPVGIAPTSLATYKTSLSTARTEVNLASSNINSQQQLINSQKLTVQKMDAQLELEKAGSTPEDIAAQEALVQQAQATVDNYQAQYENTIIRAPFDGVVTKVNPETGEIASPTSPAISLISNAKFQVDSNISEVDIAKIKVNDTANITLDAYGSDVIFQAKVVSIDPAETIIEGVPTYKTTFQFIDGEDKIKSGMTANIDVKTAEKKHVLVVPSRTVKIDGETKSVSVLDADGKTVHDVQVETGIRGSDGNIEILSGLKEGNRIVIPNF